jgi:uncharacterized Zn finger protein
MLRFPDFEKGIQKKILERGFDYYEYQNLEKVEDLGNSEFSAIVHGNEDYEVYVKIEGNHVSKQSCTCPYVEEYDDTCKHIVAVLYYIRDSEMYKSSPTIKTVEKKLTKILKSISVQELRDYVTEYAKRHRKFRDDLVRDLGG